VRWILPLDGILHQRRKGAAAEPCVNHLVEVANLVAQAAQASEPSLIIAALLHDTIEDQDVKAETIAKEFGNTSPKLWWK
jgi:Guanosine polyphosphate pyrophosphohydrolases/synthetases